MGRVTHAATHSICAARSVRLVRMNSELRSKAQDIKALRLILPFLWPKDDRALRGRLLISLFMLALTAAVNAVVPILFSRAVDVLTANESALVVAPIALLLGYGLMQWLSRILNELRWIYYGPVEQRLRRSIGLTVFRHVNELSLRYPPGPAHRRARAHARERACAPRRRCCSTSCS